MTSPVIYAAAYLLLVGQPPTEAPVPSPIYDPVMCQLPTPPAPVSGHMSAHHLAVVRGDPPRHAMRGVRWHHHHHCVRVGRSWRCRA